MNKYPHATAQNSPVLYLSVKFSGNQHIEPGENWLTLSVLLFVVSLIPPYFHCTDRHQPFFSVIHWIPWWPNQSRNIGCGTLNAVLWAFPSFEAAAQLYVWFVVCFTFANALVLNIQITIPVQPIFGCGNAIRCTIQWYSAGWRSNLLIGQTFHTCIRPPERSFVDKAGGNDDLSDKLNAAAPSCWKLHQDTLLISSVLEMYPTAVIGMFWVRDSSSEACKFWLPRHISKMFWTLACLSKLLCSASFFHSRSISISAVSNTAQSPANIPLLVQANCLTIPFSLSITPVDLYWLQPMTSRARVYVASTPTPCGIIENMSRATLEKSGLLSARFLLLAPPVGDIR